MLANGLGTTVPLAVVVVGMPPVEVRAAVLHWLGEKLLLESERPMTASRVTVCSPRR